MTLKVDCISDLHGYYPELSGGDLLIVAGDLTARDEPDQHANFGIWLKKQQYRKKIVIAGNHDRYLEKNVQRGITIEMPGMGCTYLCDSGTEFEGIKIWGSPWSAQFPGINPKCCAFTVNFGSDTETLLNDHWEMIPADIDILITHTPPYDILDECESGHVGSKSLRDHSLGRIKPQLHIFGHIHECGGKVFDSTLIKFVNASVVNERYEHVNKSVRIEL
jgi:Icc-related predicted phosphoesterase